MKRQGKRSTIVVWFATMVGLLGPGAIAAQAEIIMSEPVHVGAPINDARDVQESDFSHDGLELYYAIGTGTGAAGGGYGGKDIFVSKRETLSSPWQEPVNLGPVVNSAGREMEPSISGDGLELYFGCWTDYVLRVCTRPSQDAPWSSPVKIGPPVGAQEDYPSVGGNDAWGPDISADGLSLYFASSRGGGYGQDDIWVARRATTADPWTAPENLGPNVNSGDQDWAPSISTDGLTLAFSRGLSSIWVTTRKSVDDAWGPAVRLGISGPGSFFSPALSPDGSTLYFQAVNAWGGFGQNDFWQVTFIPVVDFNGDGKVDAADMALLTTNWGKNQTLCDIGPLPLGDGVVDEKDLRVLMESVVTPRPHDADVACDTILSWISPSVMGACDVYFGTSREAVSNANRANPQEVLASLGQTATTYDPEGILDFGRTYYWRVDFVIPGPTPTVYRGPVLDFTTASSTYRIKNIIATASSFQGPGPYRTVDGSGLDAMDRHSTNAEDMWLSNAASPRPAWIQYEFDKVHALHELWVWNSNQTVEPLIGFGAKTVKVDYSTDGTTWTPLANVPEFARAPGQPGYVHNTTVSFGGVSAKFVKLTVEKGWGVTPSVGLSEVRFFAIQSAAVAKP